MRRGVGYCVSQVPLPDREAEQEPERLSFADQQQLKIHEILSCGSDWTASEQWVLKWRFRLLGDFQAALAEAISLADEYHTALLRSVFPIQVDGYVAWTTGRTTEGVPRDNLAERLRATGLEI